MGLSKNQITYIKEVLKKCLRDKFRKYEPESKEMPFHFRLLGKDRMALYSFIQSLNTTFGVSIFEPVAIALASTRFKSASSQIKPSDFISENAQFEIQKIIDNLTAANVSPDKKKEIETIRKVCQKNPMRKVKLTKIDIYLEDYSGELFFFDIKTVKPNKGDFIKFKRTLLELVAVTLASNPSLKVNTLIAIPYNPYEPKPYNRWTMAGMMDLKAELKVANEFWDFLGGNGTYKILLDCFEKVGIELRAEIDKYFLRFNK